MEDNQPKWQYKPNGNQAQDQSFAAGPKAAASGRQSQAADVFVWQTAEYIEHERNFMWYVVLFAGAGLLAGLMYLITKDYISAGVVMVLAVVVMIAAVRKPGQLNCEVSNSGIKIGAKTYPYNQFKSFGIIREGLLPTVELFSTKKFVPAVAVHFNAQDEQQITSVIGAHLPYEERKMAGIDKLAHRLRF